VATNHVNSAWELKILKRFQINILSVLVG